MRVCDRLGPAPRFRHEELFDAVQGTWQGESVGGDRYEEDVGEGGREVDHLGKHGTNPLDDKICSANLAAGFDPLDEASEADNPGEEQTKCDVPLDLADVAGVGERVGEVGQAHRDVLALDRLRGLGGEGEVDATNSSVEELLA